ncbi:MAG: trigger factor, partial [Roseimicrobium sp.]
AKKFEQEILEEMKKALVRRGFQEASKRDQVEILNVLAIRDEALHADNHFTFTMEVSTAPKFELPDYKGIPVKLPRIEVTEEDVDHNLLHVRENNRTFSDVDRPAVLGDFVVLHAKATLDGASVAEAYPDAPAILKQIEGNWFELKSQEKSLPGFFEGLMNIKGGEDRDVTVTLPEDAGIEGLNGKTIVLHVHCDAVKEPHLPELEVLAKKLNKDWDLERLRTEIRADITRRRERSRDNAKTNQVIQHLAEKLEFDLPQDIVNREAQRRTNDIAMNALRNGMEQDRIMEVQDQIVSAATQQARQNVKVSFILGEVAKREKLTVREEQVRMALSRIAVQQKAAPKKFLAESRKNGLIDKLQDDILLDNALQFLKENAAVEETEPEKDDCGHDHSH